MKTTLELVHDLQALLSGPKKWTQGAMARNAYGSGRGALKPDACRWCIRGAMIKLQADSVLVELCVKAMPDVLITAWNDAPERTFADIQALMAKMEELAKDQP